MGAEIGLKAVMDMVGFTKGINDYNDKVGDASSKTEKGSSKITAALGTIGKVAAGLAVSGVTALTAAITGSIAASISWADKVDNVGDVLGTTAEESSALAVAAEYIGGNVEQLTSQMAVLTRGLFDAKGEIGPTGIVLQGLGIAFQDAAGNILPTTDILQSVADKLAVMPDGLEKTQLMMDLFGKSGKDMSDMMGILANGGMEDMNQKAKDLGLSLGEEAAQGAIEAGRQFNELKLMGKGLFVQLGTELLPILTPLIEDFSTMAKKAIPYVRQAILDAIPVIQEMFRWFKENLLPIIVDVANFLIQNIPPAVGKAAQFFNTYLLPAIKAIWEFIKDPLLPILADVVTWLIDTIGGAVSIALPIIKKIYTAFYEIWGFVYNTLLPILGDVIDWLIDTVSTAVSTFKGIWDKVYKAFKDTWSFVSDNVLPIFKEVADYLSNGWSAVVSRVQSVWGSIKAAVQPLVDIFNAIKGAIEYIISHIGSALSGSSNYANSISDAVFLKLEEIEAGHGGRPGAPGGPRRGLPPNTPDFNYGGMSTNNAVTINMNVALNNGMDTEAFRVMVLDTVSGALA